MLFQETNSFLGILSIRTFYVIGYKHVTGNFRTAV